MSAVIVQVADAVVSRLNGATLSQAFTAVRSWVSVLQRAELDGLSVVVVPSILAVFAKDLQKRRDFDWEVNICVEKKVRPIPDDVDPMMLLCEEIIDLFLPGESLTVLHAKCIGARMMNGNDPQKLDINRLFTATITLTYRVSR